jgi:hypothetical protein
MFTSFINPTAILISLCTASGVLLHDMRIDKAMTTALAAPSNQAVYETGSKLVNFTTDLHTHTERSSFSQAVHDLNTQTPRVQPRNMEDRKHLLPKYAARGHHAFDNYNLPIV